MRAFFADNRPNVFAGTEWLVGDDFQPASRHNLRLIVEVIAHALPQPRKETPSRLPSGGKPMSISTTRPPGAVTRAISRIACGASGKPEKAKVLTTVSKLSAG